MGIRTWSLLGRAVKGYLWSLMGHGPVCTVEKCTYELWFSIYCLTEFFTMSAPEQCDLVVERNTVEHIDILFDRFESSVDVI
eukprot:m.506694 g.506694  ORF g.506694 m.506694 type:complete len:82 (-) comp21876_c1_seq1:104-349(-)